MKQKFLRKTVFAAALILLLYCTSCGQPGANENEGAGKVGENADVGRTRENVGTGEQDVGEALFYDGADLAGRVMEFTEGGFTITPTTSEEVDGGSLLEEAAPGHEEESEFIHITYAEDVSFQIVILDIEAQKETSRMDTNRDSIKKQTEVAVFGTKQDEKNWTAVKVLIIRWQ